VTAISFSLSSHSFKLYEEISGILTLLCLTLCLFLSNAVILTVPQIRCVMNCSLGARESVVYRVSQEKRSIFWEVIVSVILSKKKKVYMDMCPIPNRFRDRVISQCSTLHTVQTINTPCPHASRKVH
jgi:hypothetical protein